MNSHLTRWASSNYLTELFWHQWAPVNLKRYGRNCMTPQMNEDISSTVNEKIMDDGASVSNVQEQGIVEPDTEEATEGDEEDCFFLRNLLWLTSDGSRSVILGWPFSVLAVLPVTFHCLKRSFNKVFLLGAAISVDSKR
ncbi:hypothetical protein IFM89_008007 [Coptis chinensis]|uniref:Uncharacterized protein n=1 Tax=Coptis chinensis TaxID=261450 RepID=A0A835HUJ0_9MAGN|nr:hypothetical protein IFM89_008007 [Coptis chinensis]